MKSYKRLIQYTLLAMLLGVSPFFSVSAESSDTFPETSKLLDMTYAYDETTIYWPRAEPFRMEKLDWGILKGGWWYASNNFSTSEHGGTHADAPLMPH